MYHNNCLVHYFSTEQCILGVGDSNSDPLDASAASTVQTETFPHPIMFVVSLKIHELAENNVRQLHKWICTHDWCRQATANMEKFPGGALDVMSGLVPFSFQLMGS